MAVRSKEAGENTKLLTIFFFFYILHLAHGGCRWFQGEGVSHVASGVEGGPEGSDAEPHNDEMNREINMMV
jgi:hypothetical protein